MGVVLQGQLNKIEGLIPHRGQMLLIDQCLEVTSSSAVSTVTIHQEVSFFIQDKGVPSCIGLEYMGQTAAMIAGYGLQNGTLDPHLGYLLGCRNFRARVPFFNDCQVLRIECQQQGTLPSGLSTFSCQVVDHQQQDTVELLAEAMLSVYRQPI